MKSFFHSFIVSLQSGISNADVSAFQSLIEETKNYMVLHCHHQTIDLANEICNFIDEFFICSKRKEFSDVFAVLCDNLVYEEYLII